MQDGNSKFCMEFRATIYAVDQNGNRRYSGGTMEQLEMVRVLGIGEVTLMQGAEMFQKLEDMLKEMKR